MGEPGATPEQNALRELAEELGAEPVELIPLGTMHPDTGLAAGYVHLFAARIDTVGPVERAEAIRRAVRLPFPEAESMAADGRITCGFTLAVLYRARLAGLPAV
jgi:ADP-ribose pyrophosphatase